jgi:hypothetical protein
MSHQHQLGTLMPYCHPGGVHLTTKVGPFTRNRAGPLREIVHVTLMSLRRMYGDAH